MPRCKIILLGASKRVDSIQLLLGASEQLGVKLELFSIESNPSLLHPISDLAEVVKGPEFQDPKFLDSVTKIANSTHSIVVPFMDSAAIGISRHQSTENLKLLASADSEMISNKRLMKKVAGDFGVEVIPNTLEGWPKILKPEAGFGSKGHQLAKDEKELTSIQETQKGLIVEDFLPGQESTVDVYFRKDSKIHSLIARDRLIVESGEVISTKTRDANPFEIKVISAFSKLKLVGPVNFQFLKSREKEYLLEINPRFSGGSTASIRAGWQAWKWILQEYLLNEELEHVGFRHVEVYRSRRDHVKFL